MAAHLYAQAWAAAPVSVPPWADCSAASQTVPAVWAYPAFASELAEISVAS